MSGAKPARRRPGRPRLEEPSEEYRRKREALIGAAAELFRQRGYAATTLDEVAEALDVRKASLYYYVRSKDALLQRVFERALRQAIEKVEGIDAIDDPARQLDALIELQIGVVTEDPGHFAVFFDELGARRTSLSGGGKSESLRQLERAYFNAFRRTVERAVAAGVLRPVDPTYAAQALIGLTSWTYKWFDPARHDPAEIARTCKALLRGGQSG